MRAFLDNILNFIQSESLTDEEYDSIDEELSPSYSKEVYLSLRSLLEERESVSWQLIKLKHLFLSKGVKIESVEVYSPTSNILIGRVL